MFGYKITKDSVMKHMKNMKSHLGTAYNNTKNILNGVDSGMRIAKKAYAVLAPVIDQYVGSNASKAIMKGITGYDSLRNKIMEGHDIGMGVHHKLKHAGLT